MKKKFIVLVFLLFIFSCFCNCRCQAASLDEIVNYEVTVDPRLSDGTLDIMYEITWKVLDSTSQGPLEWVQIGTPNSNFDNVVALTSNIKSIKKYNGSYVRIDFKKKYYAGDQVKFKYKIHQSKMYTLSNEYCKYSFTPAWFNEAMVDNITVKWNADSVVSNNSMRKEDNYLVWSQTSLVKGQKVNCRISYNVNAFSSLNEDGQKISLLYNPFFIMIIGIVAIVILLFVSIFFFIITGGGYYRHRGFYGGYYGYYDRGCVYSRCACVHSSCASSCACACAGSGRAGCSKKDFYGTKLDSNKLKEALKKF